MSRLRNAGHGSLLLPVDGGGGQIYDMKVQKVNRKYRELLA